MQRPYQNDNDNHISGSRGAELGKAIGYENGYWYGKTAGTISSGILGSVYGFTNLKTITGMITGTGIGILALTGIGYFLGGIYGAKRGSEYCEKKGRALAESGKMEEEIIDTCKSESAIQGGLGGGLAGITPMIIPFIISSYSLESLGDISVDNIDDTP